MNILANYNEEIKVPCPECKGEPYTEYMIGDELMEDICTYCNTAGEVTQEEFNAHPQINYIQSVLSAELLEVAA